MVVAQLAEWSLPTPPYLGSNPVIINLYRSLTYSELQFEKTKIMEKRNNDAVEFIESTASTLLKTK